MRSYPLGRHSFLMNPEDRWFLPDLDHAMDWCRQRHTEGIRCTIATLAEYAVDRSQSSAATEQNMTCIRTVAFRLPDTSIAIKPTAIGMLFDPGEYLSNLRSLFEEAEKNEVDLDIDMEGTDHVEATVRSACDIAKEHPVTLALQAYLDRTSSDCDLCTGKGIRIRLVKGAYLGDTTDYENIQERFKILVSKIANTGENFCVGTHDPEIIRWITEDASVSRHQVEFGFLKGLADQTKKRLVDAGWDVSEYVPYGSDGRAYRSRREYYLKLTEKSGRTPAP